MLSTICISQPTVARVDVWGAGGRRHLHPVAPSPCMAAPQLGHNWGSALDPWKYDILYTFHLLFREENRRMSCEWQEANREGRRRPLGLRQLLSTGRPQERWLLLNCRKESKGKALRALPCETLALSILFYQVFWKSKKEKVPTSIL